MGNPEIGHDWPRAPDGESFDSEMLRLPVNDFVEAIGVRWPAEITRPSAKRVIFEKHQMEYFRDPRNQIQADIAYRLCKVADQYRKLDLPSQENFSVTLDVCILQNLLTTCVELLKAMSRNEKKAYLTADIDSESPFGLRLDMIKKNTFDGRLTCQVLLMRLRNALSHPTELNLDDTFPSTGYTTIPNASGSIQRYCFVNSPDTKSGRAKIFDSWDKAEKELRDPRSNGGMPQDVKIIPTKEGKFCFGLDNQPFARIFEIHFTGEEIHEFVIGLSNHLAQPIQENWDGVTVTPLLAA